MIRKTKLVAIFAVLLVVLLATVYFVENFYSNTGTTVYSNVVNGFQLSLSPEAKTTTFRQGDNIRVNLTLTNVAHQTMNLSFVRPDSFLQFNVYNDESMINRPLNATSPCWQQMDDGRLNTIILASGKSIDIAFYWDTGARDTPTGVYQLVGLVTDLDQQTWVFRTEPLNVTITK